MDTISILLSVFTGLTALTAVFLPFILFFNMKGRLRRLLGRDYKAVDISIVQKKNLMILYLVAAVICLAQYYLTHQLSFLLFLLIWMPTSYFTSGMGRKKIFYNEESFALMDNDSFTGTGLNVVRWEYFEKIEWDRDFNQTEWGLKIFVKGRDYPYRYYIRRKDKDRVDGFFAGRIF